MRQLLHMSTYIWGHLHRCAAPRMTLTVSEGVGLYGYVDESATADDIAEWEVHTMF